MPAHWTLKYCSDRTGDTRLLADDPFLADGGTHARSKNRQFQTSRSSHVFVPRDVWRAEKPSKRSNRWSAASADSSNSNHTRRRTKLTSLPVREQQAHGHSGTSQRPRHATHQRARPANTWRACPQEQYYPRPFVYIFHYWNKTYEYSAASLTAGTDLPFLFVRTIKFAQ